ncbi:hydrolase [Romboutsia weinsteinii]|uniref:Hydrolase n=1 Tax=Romboutsia weinsteinii TaxID=2020949 RepID=A0A371J9N2_9FIRM|nr:VanW family protein [Romboutsia weinsteinii]RDY29459.1 hydrolase [Romboutsia weinsteinii]
MTSIKRNIYISIAIVIAIVGIFIGVMYSQINGDKISKNTYINEIDVSGMTKIEAIKELEKKYTIGNIKFSYSSDTWDISPKDISLKYNLEDTVEKAYKFNKGKSFGENLINTIKSNFGKVNNIEVSTEYNEEKLKDKIENIAKEIDVEVKDASISISGSNINITDDQPGLKVNVGDSVSEFKNKVSKGNLNPEIIVTKVEAKIKKEELESIDTVLGSHSTKFDGGTTGRNTNIRLAAERTSNVLLMPGESFSYNDHTGLRTIANGYKNAPVIVQGVVQEGVGGGVCQVSTTLYNATLYAGLEYVNLRNHSIPSSYAEKGRDATVADGSIDFVFKNNLSYPIYVNNYVSGNTVTCQIYGSYKDKQKIEIVTSTDGVSAAPTKKVDDPTLPQGQEKVLEKGRDGYTVSTYRVYKDGNGDVLKKEKVSTSYYPKKQGVIAVGTMQEAVQPPENQPPVEESKPPEENAESQTPQPNPPQEPVPQETAPEEPAPPQE